MYISAQSRRNWSSVSAGSSLTGAVAHVLDVSGYALLLTHCEDFPLYVDGYNSNTGSGDMTRRRLMPPLVPMRRP